MQMVTVTMEKNKAGKGERRSQGEGEVSNLNKTEKTSMKR
jgi:hypothetical protein